MRAFLQKSSPKEGSDRSRKCRFGAVFGYIGRSASFSRAEKEKDPGDPNYYDPASHDWYYYVNAQFNELYDGDWGLFPDLRNAVYLTESQLSAYYDYYVDVSTDNLGYYTGVDVLSFNDFKAANTSFPDHPYRRVNGESYTFMGWYQVFDDGSVSTMPYNFNDPVMGELTLRALWRLEGGYFVQYNPYSFAEDTNGQITAIIGDMSQWTDPANPSMQLYADQALTHVLQAPTPSSVTSGWVFRGWRVVREDGTGTYNDNGTPKQYTIWTPIQLDAHGDPIYYQPGDNFTIDSGLATEISGNAKIIHMQAYYEPEGSSARRPEVTNLILDANDDCNGYVNTTNASGLPALSGPGSQSINTTTEQHHGDPTQILLGDFQSNIALHLNQYAVSPDSFFTHDDGYLLIGFDENADPLHPSTGDAFVPAYAADSVIAVTRDDHVTLYAMWEPMVYVTFVNTTAEPITIDLSGTGASTVSVVNLYTGAFDRTATTNRITVPANDGVNDGQVKIVLPGAVAGTDSFTASALNDHAGKLLSVSGEYPVGTPHGTGSSDVPEGFSTVCTGLLVSDADGIIVTYTETDVPIPRVFFDMNAEKGGVTTWTETDTTHYADVTGMDVLYAIEKTDVPATAAAGHYPPSDPTSTSKVFIGWTTNADIAAHTDFSSTTSVTWGSTTITPDAGSNVLEKVRSDYLYDFTQSLPPDGDLMLHAVWSDTVTVTFDLVRTGSNLHVWQGPATETTQKPYVFYRSSDASGSITYTLAKGDRVPMPNDPTADPLKPNWFFLKWLLNDISFRDKVRANNKNDINGIENNAYDFAQHVTNNITLSTSWTQLQPQHFTFTVENRVEGGNVNDEFAYTISVSNEKVRGKLGNNPSNSNGIPDRRWGSVTTTLRNNQEYTVDVKVSSTSATSFSVEITVIDQEGTVVKSGHVIYCNKNGISPYFVSDFMYTLTITQNEKVGYTMTVRKEGETPADSIASSTDDSSRTFTFYSCICTTSGQESTFTPVANGYVAGANNRLTVVFTNTGAVYPSPTGVTTRILPFALMLLGGLCLIPIAITGRRRRKDEA